MQYRHAIVFVAVCAILLLIRLVASLRASANNSSNTNSNTNSNTKSRDPFVPASMYYLNTNSVWQESGGPGTAEYMHLQMTAQTNANISAGADLAFDTVAAASAGGYIVRTTPATITLSAGSTYKCVGCVLGTSSAASYCWFNQSATPPNYVGVPAAPGDYAISYVACTQTTTISLRAVSGTAAITGTPAGTAGAVLYAWAVVEILNNSMSVAALSGSTPTSDGTGGYVPAPSAGQHRSFLRGDGTWAPAQQLSNNPIAYGGALCGVALATAGSGYVSPPAVTIAAPPPGGVPAVAVAILANGTVSAITLINVGYGYTADPAVTVTPPPAGGVPAVAVAYARVSGLESPSNCGNLLGSTSSNAYIRQDGTVWAVGNNNAGAAAPPPNTHPAYLQPMVWSSAASPQPVVAKVWAAQCNRYILGGNGYLYATGQNQTGSLGTGNTTGQTGSIVPVMLPPGLVKFACTYGWHPSQSITTCLALLGNGQLYGWGYNAWGELGLNTTAPILTPTRLVINAGSLRPFIDTLYTITDIKLLGVGHNGQTSVLLCSNGQVLLAGKNNRAQCANGSTNDAQTSFVWAMANQSLVNGSFGGGLSTAPVTYGLAGAATLTTTAAGVTTMRVAGTYTITLTMNNYSSGGTPTVTILKNGTSIGAYTFTSTGNTFTMVNSPALVVGDVISFAVTSPVTGSFNISGVAILSGITQIAGTGSDHCSSVAFLQGSTNMVFVSGNNDNFQWGTGTNGSANQYANPTAPIPSPIISISGAGNTLNGGGSTGFFVALTNAGLYTWGYNAGNFTRNSPDGGNTHSTPQLYWPPTNGLAGTIKKVLCHFSNNNTGGIAILLTDGRIYYNGANPNNVGGLPMGGTGGWWLQTFLFRRDVVDITFTGDQSNQNMAILLSNGELYATGWNGNSQVGAFAVSAVSPVLL